MLDGLRAYNKEHNLFNEDDRLVFALSGGVDSMVLADLLQKAGARFIVAHCNFHLRGAESDWDEAFVRDYAVSHGLPCFVRHFDTKRFADEKGISIEMAARDLRYAWFEELRQVQGCDKIVIAHHADDQIETFFINLLRGAGLHGLKGMKPQNGVLIRPMLWASRKQIRDYAIENHIAWREDHTNAESVYLRNKIRNELMPAFDGIDAGARKSIAKSVEYLSSESALYDALLKEFFDMHLEIQDEIQSIDKGVFNGPLGSQLLFEWLRHYGFNTEQCRFVMQSMNGVSGKCFYAPDYRLTVDRKSLTLSPKKAGEQVAYEIDATEESIAEPVGMRFSSYDRPEWFEIDRSPDVAQIDADKVRFPLHLRHWREGDRFHPLGLKGSKLLSDFFVDNKFSQNEKENLWILEDADNVMVWLVGWRISEEVKITSLTRRVFECRLL